MSRFASESNSAKRGPRASICVNFRRRMLNGPQPVGESERGSCGDNDEFSAMHASYENHGDEERENGESDSTGKTKSFGGRMLFA